MTATLPDCPTCGGTGECDELDETQTLETYDCLDCDHGKVTVAQMAALWQRVYDPAYDDDVPVGYGILRAVRP